MPRGKYLSPKDSDFYCLLSFFSRFVIDRIVLPVPVQLVTTTVTTASGASSSSSGTTTSSSSSSTTTQACDYCVTVNDSRQVTADGSLTFRTMFLSQCKYDGINTTQDFGLFLNRTNNFSLTI